MKHKLPAILIIVWLSFLVLTLSATAQTYVGPEKCLTCHNNSALGDMTGWRTSMHANGYSHVPDSTHSLEDLLGVVADYDQNGVDDFIDGLDFNSITSAFDQYKPNAPILAYSDQDGYSITIGNYTHKVYMTYGGSGLYKQRYVVKINTDEGESNDYYISPIQYNEETDEYTTYHPDDWWDNNNQPIDWPTRAAASSNSRSLAKGCSGCHATGIQIPGQTVDGEWTFSAAGVEDEANYTSFNNVFDIDGDGDLDQINTTCEKCHGPGGAHASTGDPSLIINPAELTPGQATNLCGMCHNRGKSLPNNTFGFPFDDANLLSWQVGDSVADFFTDGGVDWPDGKHSVKHRQQYLDFIESSKPTFQFHNVTCYECHDVHNTVKHHIREQIVEEDSLGNPLVINTDNDDNTLCLACHATHGDFAAIPNEWVADPVTYNADIAAVVTQHTHHTYDPTGTGASRCSKCHNPKIAKSAVAYDIHSHTFEPISPYKTDIFQNDGNGMPNACAASCHMEPGLTFGIDFTNDDIQVWNEATDLALADTLQFYYGPNGIWWTVTGIDRISSQVPKTFSLNQNYPNPFNPATTIVYDLPVKTEIRLTVYNIIGEKVAVLANGVQLPGTYEATFDATGLASGMYIYRLEGDGKAIAKKMILMK